MLPTGDQIGAFIIWLLILFMLSIADFSFFGLPWDTEIQINNYPNIAYDATYVPQMYIGQTAYPE